MNLSEVYMRVPWDHEPNFKEFLFNNFLCRIYRSPLGYLSGYIRISTLGRGYWDIETIISEIEVYKRLHLIENIESHDHFVAGNDYFWVAFHCNDPGEIIPSKLKKPYNKQTIRKIKLNYKDINYVEGLIKQIATKLNQLDIHSY